MTGGEFADAWFLTGPTAGGKTQVGIDLSRALDAEIISLDSMAVYRDMDIGTAKPTAAERQAVTHHLVDICDPHENFSVAQYLKHARTAAGQIRSRSRRVLFVGGTPLYLKALLRGLFVGPPADWALRKQLAEIAREQGSEALHRRLTEIDPAAARRLHANDTRRLMRAIEVYEKTGQPMSELQKQFEHARPACELRVFVLDWPREQLLGRINARVEHMFATGLVQEVQGLLQSESPLGRTARQAVGYREVLEHLGGVRSLEETIELVKLRTRQFAKRQMTWYRSLSECRFVPVSAADSPRDIAERITNSTATL